MLRRTSAEIGECLQLTARFFSKKRPHWVQTKAGLKYLLPPPPPVDIAFSSSSSATFFLLFPFPELTANKYIGVYSFFFKARPGRSLLFFPPTSFSLSFFLLRLSCWVMSDYISLLVIDSGLIVRISPDGNVRIRRQRRQDGPNQPTIVFFPSFPSFFPFRYFGSVRSLYVS